MKLQLKAIVPYLLLLTGPSSSWSDEVLLSDLKKVGEGFQFTEGPVWDGKSFIFSDIPENKAFVWDGTSVHVFNNPSHYSNGRTKMKDGSIVSAHHDRTVRIYKNKELKIIANKYKGQKLNSPNDVIVDSQDRIYFTDPIYGIAYKGFGPKQEKEEQSKRGIYRLDADQSVHLLNGDLTLPNGLAFSPGEKFLYVADSSNSVIYRFEVTKDKQIQGKTPWVVLNKGEGNIVDGLKVDLQGNVYVAVGKGIVVLSPEGKILQDFLVAKDAVANLAFGGVDGKTLFITASKQIYTAKTKHAGL